MPKNFNTPDQNNNLKNNLGGKFGKKLLKIVLPISILVSSCVKEPAQPNIETIPNTINLKGTLPNVITLKGGDSTVIDLSATDLLGETLTPKISTSGNIVATVANGKLTIKSTDYNDSKGEVTIDCNSSEERNVREEDKNKDFNGDGDKDDIFHFSAENLKKVITVNIQANLEGKAEAERKASFLKHFDYYVSLNNIALEGGSILIHTLTIDRVAPTEFKYHYKLGIADPQYTVSYVKDIKALAMIYAIAHGYFNTHAGNMSGDIRKVLKKTLELAHKDGKIVRNETQPEITREEIVSYVENAYKSLGYGG